MTWAQVLDGDSPYIWITVSRQRQELTDLLIGRPEPSAGNSPASAAGHARVARHTRNLTQTRRQRGRCEHANRPAVTPLTACTARQRTCLSRSTGCCSGNRPTCSGGLYDSKRILGSAQTIPSVQEILPMYRQVRATAADTRPLFTSARDFRGAWSADAIAERDRRDFENSLKAQVERLNRTSTGSR